MLNDASDERLWTWQCLCCQEVYDVEYLTWSLDLSETSEATLLRVGGVHHGNQRRLHDQQLPLFRNLLEHGQQLLV